MPQASQILIHEFIPSGPITYDDEGSQMLGFYYQFTDDQDQPVTTLIGPYNDKSHVERAANRAFKSRDY